MHNIETHHLCITSSELGIGVGHLLSRSHSLLEVSTIIMFYIRERKGQRSYTTCFDHAISRVRSRVLNPALWFQSLDSFQEWWWGLGWRGNSEPGSTVITESRRVTNYNSTEGEKDERSEPSKRAFAPACRSNGLLLVLGVGMPFSLILRFLWPSVLCRY